MKLKYDTLHEKLQLGVIITFLMLCVIWLSNLFSPFDRSFIQSDTKKSNGWNASSNKIVDLRNGDHGDKPLIYKLSERRPEESEVGKILDFFNRSPESLVLVFFMTHDFAHLAELGRFKDNLTVSTVLAIYSADPNERLFWAKNLLKLDPNNGAAAMFVSSILLKLGRVEEATAMLEKVENSGSFDGNMGAISGMLPDASKILQENYKMAFVFDDLTKARVVGLRSLFPDDFGLLFSDKKEDEVLSLAKRYLVLIDKVSKSTGFSIADDGIKSSSVSHECASRRALVLSAVEKTLGFGSSLHISSVSAQSLTKDLLSTYQSARKHDEQMTEEEMRRVVASVLGSSAR